LDPFNCFSDELNAEAIKIGSSEDFLRASEARNLQRFFPELPKLEFQRLSTFTPFEILNLLPTEILRSWYP
jgi:hypothetical protein